LARLSLLRRLPLLALPLSLLPLLTLAQLADYRVSLPGGELPLKLADQRLLLRRRQRIETLNLILECRGRLSECRPRREKSRKQCGKSENSHNGARAQAAGSKGHRIKHVWTRTNWTDHRGEAAAVGMFRGARALERE
jgi:hypothetical protein